MLTPDEKAYVTNGCGPRFGSMGELVPDFCGLYTEACNLHDWLYWSGGPSAIRKLADIQLRHDMERINNCLPWYKRLALSWAPRVYYWWTRSKLGKLAYYRAPYRRTRQDLKKEMRDANLQ
jgi:hypothetical protein